MTYAEEYRASIDNPRAFWEEKARALDWYRPASEVLSRDEHGIDHWFADGELNTCHLALDFHVNNGRAEQTALIYDSPVTGQQRNYSFRELRDEVALCAGMLKNRGQGRSRGNLPADDSRGADLDARLRATRCSPLGGFRRLRPA